MLTYPTCSKIDLLCFGLGESGGEKDDGAVDLEQAEYAGRRHVFARSNRLKSHKRNLHGQNQTCQRGKAGHTSFKGE